MGFLVGNDFIPHLPGLNIHSGALPVLYTVYCQILPTLDGEKTLRSTSFAEYRILKNETLVHSAFRVFERRWKIEFRAI